MIFQKLKPYLLPVIFIVWNIVFIVFIEQQVFLQYECCDEYKYLNNYEVIIINALPFIIASIIMIFSILLIKIDAKLLIYEIAFILFFSCWGLFFTVASYFDNKGMLTQLDNMDYAMIEDTIYSFCITMVIVSGVLRYLLIMKRAYK